MARDEMVELREREAASRQSALRMRYALRLVTVVALGTLIPTLIQIGISVFESGFYKSAGVVLLSLLAAIAALVAAMFTFLRSRRSDDDIIIVDVDDYTVALQNLPIDKRPSAY